MARTLHEPSLTLDARRLTPRVIAGVRPAFAQGLNAALTNALCPTVAARLDRDLALRFRPPPACRLNCLLAGDFFLRFTTPIRRVLARPLVAKFAARLGIWVTTQVTPSTICGMPLHADPPYVANTDTCAAGARPPPSPG